MNLKWPVKISLALSIVFTAIAAQAQQGYYGVYKFMNLPPSSRLAALGGTQISVIDNDLNLGMQNPALLNPQMHNHLSLSYMDYHADINFGSIGYARNFDSVGTIMAGVQYIDYGDFVRTDERGNKIGSFQAAEYNYFAGIGRQWKRFSYGTQLKFLYSNYESYNSYGLAADVGGAYNDTAHGFSAGIVFKNMGAQLKSFSGTREPLPFEIQLGASIKPKHMPVRFTLLLHDLQKFDLTYINPNEKQQIDLTTGQPINATIPFTEKLARHINIGAEILISKNFHIRAGYNHQRRKEMTIPDNRGMVGYSLGFGFKVSKFHVSYGHAVYHIGSSTNTFTLATNFSDFYKRKTP